MFLDDVSRIRAAARGPEHLQFFIDIGMYVMRARIKLVPCHREDGVHEGLAGSLKVRKQCRVIVFFYWSGLVDDVEENLSCFLPISVTYEQRGACIILCVSTSKRQGTSRRAIWNVDPPVSAKIYVDTNRHIDKCSTECIE